MSIPLWCLLGFAAWTLAVAHLIFGWRVYMVLTRQRRSNAFKPDASTGPEWQQRVTRAHMNCVENLPVFGAVVLVAAVSGTSSPALDTLAMVYLAGRILQTSTHLYSTSPIAVNVRFAFYLAQVVSLVGFVVLVGLSGAI